MTAGSVGLRFTGAHRAQGYEGQADWELIREVAQRSPLPIVGNGDILTSEQARRRVEQGYAHAVMIGRGALKNPWIFAELHGQKPEDRDLSALIKRHFELAMKNKEERRAFISLRKFFGWYAAGLPNSSQFRKRLFETTSPQQLQGLALDFFSTVDPHAKGLEDKPFLMGGHG